MEGCSRRGWGQCFPGETNELRKKLINRPRSRKAPHMFGLLRSHEEKPDLRQEEEAGRLHAH